MHRQLTQQLRAVLADGTYPPGAHLPTEPELIQRYAVSDMRGIYDEMVQQGLEPETELLEFARVVPPPGVAQRLQTGRRLLVSRRRLYRLDGKPFGLSWVHLNPGPA